MLNVDFTKKLDDFTLEVRFSLENDILVLFGPSGCGKTTTLRCLAGLEKPDAGHITHNGRALFSDAAKVFVPPRQRRVGYMFQDYALFPHMSVKKNIFYGVKQAGGQADELYERLTELLRIRHLAGRYVGQLSGGEKQRVALARALMAEPTILLLDEPLSSLDQFTRQELQAELKELQQLWGIPFIIVTHDLQEAKSLGDRFLFLDRGRQTDAPPPWEARRLASSASRE